jgi:hypothetical protein
MNKLQTNVNDIKSVAKILKKELANMNFELSHSSALNLASRSLGFKNYQAYNGLLEKKDDKKISFSHPFSEIKKEIEERKLEEYPRIYNQFVKIGHTQKYDIYIDKELSEDKYYYYLIFELKDSYTGRVFFTPKYDTFSLYVYPDIKEASSPYDFKMEGGSDFYFKKIQHLNRKSWLTKELLDDLMELMESIKKDRKALIEISNKHSKEELEQRYKGQKND